MVGYVEIFRPRQIDDVVGCRIQKMLIDKWFKSMNKPLLLIGGEGLGKTTLAYLYAKRYGYKIIGLNASDERNKDMIERIVANPPLAKVVYIFEMIHILIVR